LRSACANLREKTMTKFKLFDEDDTEPTTILRLIRDAEGARLIVCDRRGVMVGGGIVCEITEKGIGTFPGFSGECGIRIDNTEGRVAIYEVD
jgi:hypothetical protein